MKREKYIIAKAEDPNKLFGAIQGLANLYADSEFTDEVYVKRIIDESDQYVIEFPNQPDFELFKYFVNYLYYPESMGFGTETKGYCTIKNGDDLPESFLDSRAMLFVSKNDTEHDNVFCVFDSETNNYKLGFASGEEFVKLEGLEASFFEENISDDNLELIKTVRPDKELIEKRKTTKQKATGCLALIPIFLAIAVLGVLFTACSTSEESKNGELTKVSEVKKSSNPICFNHAVLVLDSTTYYEAVNSEFIKQFSFSEERQLNGYKGFYLFGETNYLELFHPKSFDGYEEEEGGIWICLAALNAHYIKSLNCEKRDFVEYAEDDHYYDLSVTVGDSTTPITTWEMTKNHYESWTKKQYNDSLEFLPVDYCSPQDSDSSSNYLMNDIVGIRLRLNPDDSLAILRYLNTVGFEAVSEKNGITRVSNNDQFIELKTSNAAISPSINRFYIQLSKSVGQSTEVIGNSRIECDGNLATWFFE